MPVPGSRRLDHRWTICGLAVILSAGIVLTGTTLAAVDPAPLELKSLRFSPAAIDTGSNAAVVTINFTVGGGVSGASYFEASFVDPSGVSRQSATARIAPTQSATLSIKFPQFAGSGTWTLASVFISDSAGNTLSLDTAELSRHGFATRLEVTSVRDTVSPTLAALTFAPARIDTSTGPVDVKVTYTATDDLAGVTDIELTFMSPSGAGQLGGSAKVTATRSISSVIAVSFPRLSEPGPWTLSSVFLADAAGNTLVLGQEDLSGLGFRTTLDVRSATDTTSPKLTAIHFTPDAINTSAGPATVQVAYAATDDLSGVKSVEVVFVSPSGTIRQSGSGTFSPATSVANSLNVTFPQNSEPGRWMLASVFLADAAGNTLSLDRDLTATLGSLSTLDVRSAVDQTTPTLTAFHFAPDAIDTHAAPATVQVRYTATDDLSGATSIEVTFVSPSGSMQQGGSAKFSPAASVTGSLDVRFPPGSEPGMWTVTSVFVADAAGNTLILDASGVARLGFGSVLRVVRPN
jgi:hypothetical protein